MTTPIQILLGTETRGHSWTSACLLAGALPLERFRVTIAALGPAPDAQARADMIQLAPHAQLAILEVPLETDKDPWAGIDEVKKKLVILCERIRPNVIHASQLSLGSLAWDAPRVVTAFHELLSWGKATGKTPAVDLVRYRAEVKAGLTQAQVVVAPTASLASELERSYKLREKVRIIRSGVPAAPRATLERGLTALTCGSLDDPAEHFDWLVACASRLPGPVGVAGCAIARALPKPLVNLGRLPRKDLLALMGGTKVFLGLSRYDTCGVAIAEANAAGAKLILADTAANRELWSGQAELVRDPESLANAIVRAHAAPRLPRPAAPRYAINQTAAAYARLYEELTQ